MVEDSVQEALLLVTERIHSFRGDSRFISWALVIATRVALTELRRARWREVSLEEMAEAGKIPPADTDSQSAHASYAHAQLINADDAAIQNNLPKNIAQSSLPNWGALPPMRLHEGLVRTEMPSTNWSMMHVSASNRHS